MGAGPSSSPSHSGHGPVSGAGTTAPGGGGAGAAPGSCGGGGGGAGAGDGDAVGEESIVASLRAEAESWIEAHRIFEFEATYADAKLKRAGCPVFPFLYGAALTDDSYGINFTRAVCEGDSAADLQAAMDFMCMQHLAVPDFEVPEGWRVSARTEEPSFRSGEEDQEITIESFDGSTLSWTVATKRFVALRCERLGPGGSAAWQPPWPAAPSVPPPLQGGQPPSHCPAAGGTSFDVRGEFRGLLHFACPMRLEV